MSPIRVALIGLSTTSSGTNWGANAHLPYLQSPQGRAHFDIVALCNSSEASAKKSVAHYKLPESTRTYGAPEDLAKDSDVDLVVNVTDVKNHYALCLPMVKAGRNVYTELPLASTMEQMEELVGTAKANGIKTVFGMQAQNCPSTKLLKETIAAGKIGKVLSTTWVGQWEGMDESPLPISHRSLTERSSGGSHFNVTFLHGMNHILSVLGEITSFNSILGMQRSSISLMDPSQSNKIVETIKPTTPDHVLLQGRLDSGALISWTFRTGKTFPGQPNCRWEIYGEKGALFFEGPMALSDIVNKGVSIKLHENGKEEAEVLELPSDNMSDLPDPAQNVGRIYEAYAKGEEGSYPDWELAMKRHELIQQMWNQCDGAKSSGEPVGL